MSQRFTKVKFTPASEPSAPINHGLQHINLDGVSKTKAFLHGSREIPFHWHREMEILITLKGSAKIVVEGQLCLMREGDLMIINAHEAHNSVSLSADTIICGVHLDLDHYERMGLTEISKRLYHCRSFLHGKSFDKISSTIKAFVARMVLIDREKPTEAAIHLSMATALACAIHQSVPWTQLDRNAGQNRRDGRERILRIMDSLARAHRAPSLSELAEVEGISLAHLSRLFRAHTGVSFRDYSQNIKLDTVMEDLLTTDDTVFDIMDGRGIGNPSLFYNQFRQRFGCSPAKFREQGVKRDTGDMLPEDIQHPAIENLLGYLSYLPAASEMTFGMSVRHNKNVAVSGFHAFPSNWRR